MSATAFRALHVPGRPVVLPNAWDAASARLVGAVGFPAVATSSGAVARSLGYEDHEHAPAGEMLAAAARIARAVDVPVTVDAEAGYGLAPGELVERLVAAGAVGCNFEDTDHSTGKLRDARQQAERLAEIRSAAGGSLVVNARVDVFMGTDDESAVLPEAIDRAKRYLDAGADCVYPILLASPDLVREFVQAVEPAPVNVMYRPGDAALPALADLGVARISFGSGVFEAQQSWLRERLEQIVDS